MVLVRVYLAAVSACFIGVHGATVSYFRDASCTQPHTTMTAQTHAEGQCFNESQLRPPELQATLAAFVAILGSIAGNASSSGNISSLNINNMAGSTTARVKLTCEANKLKMAQYASADCSGTSTKVEETAVNQCVMMTEGIYQRSICFSAAGMGGATAAVMLLVMYLL